MKMRKWMTWVLLVSLVFCWAGARGEQIVIPDLQLQSKEIPDNQGLDFVRRMKAGWNLGNTFDAFDCNWLRDKMQYETAWCGAMTTETLIQALQDAGFNTLRIPVSWHNHLDADWVIDAPWLERVAEVVSWAYDRGMYVIVNIHHDCAPGYYYPDAANRETSEKYVRTIWQQLAERFADYDERLVFECVNEPRLKDTEYEWNWVSSSPVCQEAMAEIVHLNQVFVDTVRASHRGYNDERYLMVPTYDASPDYACQDAFTLPLDTAENRIIVSAHAYSPYDFALQQPGIDRFNLNNNAQKAGISGFMNRLYQKYVSQGIPVLMGEFGAMEKNGNLQDRVDWLSFYVAIARSRGISCCWWDNNLFQGNGERFGLFNRNTGECVFPDLLEAFMRYAE